MPPRCAVTPGTKPSTPTSTSSTPAARASGTVGARRSIARKDGRSGRLEQPEPELVAEEGDPRGLGHDDREDHGRVLSAPEPPSGVRGRGALFRHEAGR